VRQQIANLKLLHIDLFEDEEAWLLSLESETDINALLTQIVRRIEDCKALVIGTKDRAEELAARRKRFEDRIESLRSLAFKMMDAADLAKLELPEVTLSVRNVAPSVQIVDEDSLPDVACKFERKPDKAKIKELLATGSVAGAVMTNGGKTLSIRIK
jgi:hypothetical protein